MSTEETDLRTLAYEVVDHLNKVGKHVSLNISLIGLGNKVRFTFARTITDDTHRNASHAGKLSHRTSMSIGLARSLALGSNRGSHAAPEGLHLIGKTIKIVYSGNALNINEDHIVVRDHFKSLSSIDLRHTLFCTIGIGLRLVATIGISKLLLIHYTKILNRKRTEH